MNEEIKGIRYDEGGIEELKGRLKAKWMPEVESFEKMVDDVCAWIKE